MQKLGEHGAPATLPAALVANGTLANQRVVSATLGTLIGAAALAGLKSPALLIIGEVVALQSTLAWFNTAAALGGGTELPQAGVG